MFGSEQDGPHSSSDRTRTLHSLGNDALIVALPSDSIFLVDIRAHKLLLLGHGVPMLMLLPPKNPTIILCLADNRVLKLDLLVAQVRKLELPNNRTIRRVLS